MENDQGEFYLIHTDTMNIEAFWRMPAILYEVVDDTVPANWTIYEHASSKGDYLETFDSYFKWDIANGIEDNEPTAIKTFNAQVAADTTMPTADNLKLLNMQHDISVAKKDYEAALKLARERGYERPKLPELLDEKESADNTSLTEVLSAMPVRIREAHAHCINNKDEITNSTLCGCFYCTQTFTPNEIEEWVSGGRNAICPYCGMDAVLGDKSGYPINNQFLTEMNLYWFQGDGTKLDY
jgi:hypothetical protein